MFFLYPGQASGQACGQASGEACGQASAAAGLFLGHSHLVLLGRSRSELGPVQPPRPLCYPSSTARAPAELFCSEGCENLRAVERTLWINSELLREYCQKKKKRKKLIFFVHQFSFLCTFFFPSVYAVASNLLSLKGKDLISKPSGS